MPEVLIEGLVHVLTNKTFLFHFFIILLEGKPGYALELFLALYLGIIPAGVGQKRWAREGDSIWITQVQLNYLYGP